MANDTTRRKVPIAWDFCESCLKESVASSKSC